MNKTDARKTAEKITNEQLAEMLNNARKFVIDWTQVSSLNKSLTKGFVWNILAKDFNVNISYNFIVKYNLVREFGSYLPEDLKPKIKVKSTCVGVQHQEPIFDVYNPYQPITKKERP